MISFASKRYSPIGVDIGTSSIKLVQMSRDRKTVAQAARWDLLGHPTDRNAARQPDMVLDALSKGLDSRRFYGREAVVCLGAADLFIQNIRVASSPDIDLANVVRQEAQGKLPFPLDEAELRYLEAADVRHGDSMRREIVLMACHRDQLKAFLQPIVDVGLRPIAVDVEPVALVRSYASQFRRSHDQNCCSMLVNIGAGESLVVIAQGEAPLFVKYLDVGGRQMDEAVSRCLGMDPAAAGMLRMHNGDRRRDQQDPEMITAIQQALRPVCDRICSELSLCVRYYGVTFRQQGLSRVIISGGEASEELVDWLGRRLGLPCQLGDPFRGLNDRGETRRRSQWSIATGLALRGEN
ncbi:MAG: type IV pilus assembly protein PilM [Planctomycetales bacterium]|nr:type IV pilus assembly protein PilM [Planctomycetales bacterium]NIM10218.1 type IV pilus assembly protein PilM [Planctomycetales bacterium]NIN09634.1 type IV pilus assembly protein PilM [Planctomycetales bacterium]NIN78690.1 type IV pilus assembly protein PilM [Planctomycetales bacterium]NIO35935.1 type IV pilus assembly protein PilM [Planctomycetales bacterium]